VKEIFRNERLMYTLKESEDGKQVLSVVCGGMAMYTVRLELDFSEREAFQKEGKTALDLLARKLCQNPDEYEDRLL